MRRLRLLLVAGLLAPLAMAVVGAALAYFATGSIPNVKDWPVPQDLALGALAASLTMGLVTLLYKMFPRFERALRRSGTQVGMDALEVAGYPVMLVVVTMAGFGEELLFRGGLQPIIGIVPAALIFGFSHGGWRREMWAYVLAAALAGSIFGVAYQLTSDIWVPIAAHALHNIMSTFLLGKKVDLSWHGPFPVVRLIPEEWDEDEGEG